MAIDPDSPSPWTVKGMRPSVRESIVRQARQAGISVADWVTRAVQNQIAIEAGNRVIPPGKPEQHRPSGLDLGDLPAALQALAAAQAAGLPVSKVAVRGVVNLIREDVRAARGLPGRQTRPRIGQTIDAGLESGSTDIVAELGTIGVAETE